MVLRETGEAVKEASSGRGNSSMHVAPKTLAPASSASAS